VLCSQVWLNLSSDNCPLFPHLPTDDGHFGYKKKHFLFFIFYFVSSFLLIRRRGEKTNPKKKKKQIRSLRFFCRFLIFYFLFCFFIFVNLIEGEKKTKKEANT
jgi:hypothetical protein